MEFARPLAFQSPYAWAFWGILIWAYVMESRQVQRKLAHSAGHSGDDRYSSLVIFLGNGLLQLLGMAAAFYPPWQVAEAGRLPLFWGGLTVLLAGMALRMHCWQMLGAFFTHTVTIVEGHEVVTRGAYQWLRHPSYLGAVMTLAGLGMALGSLLIAGVLLVGSLLTYVYRIEVEEAALESALGERYACFKRSRARMIPFVY